MQSFDKQGPGFRNHVFAIVKNCSGVDGVSGLGQSYEYVFLLIFYSAKAVVLLGSLSKKLKI